jgi:hypothetical protein
MSNTERKPDPNPDHDRQAAGMYQAIALRFHFRYVDARLQANFRGEDLEGAEPLPTPREAGDRYERVVDEWLSEEPSTPAAVLSLVEFAAVIAADKFAGEAMCDPGPVSDEKDAFHQTVALSAVGDWLNANVVAGDWLSRRIAAYGPTAVPQKGEAAAVSGAEPDAKPIDDDRGGRDDLENALTNIAGVADVLFKLGERSEDGETLAYLSNQLAAHGKIADDAFARIFRLGEYRRKGGAA